jgi:hypothetical protein
VAAPPRHPTFLARRSYRRRRLVDLGRLLPFAGLFLCGLPMLWAPPEDHARDLAATGLYLFGVWGGLIAVAAFLARTVGAGLDEDGEGPGR